MKLESITVEQRLTDNNRYIAILNDDRKMWDTGKTPAEAIGAVLLSHQKELKFKLNV